MTIVYLIGSIILMILASNKLKIHPFLSLIVIAIVYGLLVGLSPKLVIDSINEGFGKTLGSIGLIIVLGVLIGAFLENTGAAFAVAIKIVNFLGKKYSSIAMAFMGWLISIPVYCDSGYILLNQLNKSITFKSGKYISITSVALAMGLMASHVMVPPTPGPVAAAALLNADLGLLIITAIPVSLLALCLTLVFISFLLPKIKAAESGEVKEVVYTKSSFVATLPILVPLLLIALNSINNYTKFIPNSTLLEFLGTPLIALGIGLLFALLLPKKLNKEMLSTSGWAGKALKDAAGILLITGAGGAFGAVLQCAGLGTEISTYLKDMPLGLLLPFLLAAALKTAQGSSTVAIITTATIMAPMIDYLGLNSEMGRVFLVLAIGAGSTVISHINDSYFWVVTQLNGFTVNQGYKTHSLGSLILGLSAFIITWVASLLFK